MRPPPAVTCGASLPGHACTAIARLARPNHPQGPCFEFTPRRPGAAPYLASLFCYNYAALPSLGLSASALSGVWAPGAAASSRAAPALQTCAGARQAAGAGASLTLR